MMIILQYNHKGIHELWLLLMGASSNYENG